MILGNKWPLINPDIMRDSLTPSETAPCAVGIAACLVPNVGFFLFAELTPENSRWFRVLKHPPWGVTTGQVYFPALLIANLLQGYASFVAWAADRGNTPLIIYGIQLGLLWMHYPIVLGCQSLKWGFVDMSLTLVAAVVSAIMFWQSDGLAGMCMTPHIIILVYDFFRDAWMYFNNPSDETTKRKTSTTRKIEERTD